LVATVRETRRAFRTIIRLIRADSYFRNRLSSLIKTSPHPLPNVYIYEWDLPAGTTVLTASQNGFDNFPAGLDQIPAWNYLLHECNDSGNFEGAKFAAEIAWEFNHRRPTNRKQKNWSTQDISEYVTRKVTRQQMATQKPWWSTPFFRHIILGLGPWPVGDDVDDDKTTQIASGASGKDEERSFGTGPWPKGDGTE
jgi:hypothetical protein